jgi:hypothetical protein
MPVGTWLLNKLISGIFEISSYTAASLVGTIDS